MTTMSNGKTAYIHACNCLVGRNLASEILKTGKYATIYGSVEKYDATPPNSQIKIIMVSHLLSLRSFIPSKML